MTALDVQLPFAPREWQLPLLDDNKPNIVAVVHRRAGKSTATIWRGLRKALTWRRDHIPEWQRNLRTDPPRVIHTLPQQVMWARTGLWDKLTTAAKSIDGAEVQKSDKRILLPNGGIYQIGGMDNPDAWRGGYADEIIEDESDDTTAAGLDMVVEPMLADYNGTRFKVGTPKGNGRLHAAYEAAGEDPVNTSRYLLPWQATGVFTREQIERLRSQLDEEEFAQEMECSFASPNSGSYYAKWLDAADREGRVCNVPYDPALPVLTSWDLGVDDSTAVWFFQITRSGEWRWLDYIEESGVGLDHFVRELNAREYIYGRHFLPHDVEVREQTNQGRSRRQYLQGLGVKPIRIIPACNPAERVAASRQIMARSWFNAEKTKAGRKALRAYKRQWNEAMGVWRAEPLHDWASHCADAFGHGALGGQDIGEEKKGPRVTWRPAVHGASAWLA